MCKQLKIIAKNIFGELAICKNCNCYSLTFNNLYLEFTQDEMDAFKKYVADIEIDYWETKRNCVALKRKIPIQTKQRNLIMIFNRQEISSLRSLLHQVEKEDFEIISLLEIDYTLYLN